MVGLKMKRMSEAITFWLWLVFVTCAVFAFGASANLGIFDDQVDVGSVRRPGSAEFDPAKGTYLIAGGGENMWFATDAFHFVWKTMSGDLTLASDIRWIGTGGNPHRKACLIIRQTLDPDSPYADAALHGDGLTSLQYRETPGGMTREIQSNVSAPVRLRLEKRGEYVSMSVAAAGEALKSAGGTFRIRFKEPFYVGLAVCAHEVDGLEKAVFSKVEIAPAAQPAGVKPKLESTLETVSISSKDRKVVYHVGDRIEAPNWTPDGKSLVFNRKGRLYRLLISGGQPQPIDTGFAVHCNNDHGISPDGTQLAISDQTEERELAHLRASDHRRHSPARHAPGAFLLARLVAGRQDAGLLRGAERRV